MLVEYHIVVKPLIAERDRLVEELRWALANVDHIARVRNLLAYNKACAVLARHDAMKGVK